MKIYTKTGDKGDTSLFSGERRRKYDKRIELYGTIDEFSAALSIAKEFTDLDDVKEDLGVIISQLFMLSSDFATLIGEKEDKIKRINETDVAQIEKKIDEYTTKVPELKGFITPEGSKGSVFLNLARTICRRAERRAVKLAEEEEVNPNAMLYLNRLSDYVFTLMYYSKCQAIK